MYVYIYIYTFIGMLSDGGGEEIEWKSNKYSNEPVKTGRWCPDEHRKFLQGIALHGRNWDKVAQGVLTRTTVQVRSHAQKYFKKLAHRERMEFIQSLGGCKKSDFSKYGLSDEAFTVDSMSDHMIKEKAQAEISRL